MKSRKLWVCIGACISAITAALAGDITWVVCFQTIVPIVLGYFAANTVEAVAGKGK
jgi:hypothetical protein